MGRFYLWDPALIVEIGCNGLNLVTNHDLCAHGHALHPNTLSNQGMIKSQLLNWKHTKHIDKAVYIICHTTQLFVQRQVSTSQCNSRTSLLSSHCQRHNEDENNLEKTKNNRQDTPADHSLFLQYFICLLHILIFLLYILFLFESIWRFMRYPISSKQTGEDVFLRPPWIVVRLDV